MREELFSAGVSILPSLECFVLIAPSCDWGIVFQKQQRILIRSSVPNAFASYSSNKSKILPKIVNDTIHVYDESFEMIFVTYDARVINRPTRSVIQIVSFLTVPFRMQTVILLKASRTYIQRKSY